ncbi:MAG: dihydrofolate reductase [Gemmatimonadetes bacterium]|nr:dihydrofolate reductase [Gemmatimonadota bacterium]
MTTRRIRYSVAMSLDGYIADREGGYAWIIDEPGIDFQAYLAKIDTLIMGRGTYETLRDGPTGVAAFEAFDLYVVSTTLDPEQAEGVTVIGDHVVQRVQRLKDASPAEGSGAEPTDGASAESAKDIWLFGGGVLFRSLLEAGLVDRVEVGVVPVLLGEGIPVLPGLDPTGQGGSGPDTTGPAVVPLDLHSIERFDSGITLLKYDVT